MSGTVVAFNQRVDQDAARAFVQGLLQQNPNLKAGYIAKQIDCDASTLRHFMRGRPSVPVAQAILELKGRLAQEAPASAEVAATVAAAQPRARAVDFILTRDARRVMGVCEAVIAERTIGVIIGHSGGGKTTALQEFRRRCPEAVFVRADAVMTGKQMLDEIADALGVEHHALLRPQMYRIIEVLKQSPRLVIIDEADQLVRRTSRQLEMLRTIHDVSRCPMILCGMPRLRAFLLRGPNLKENLAQIYSRVGFMVELTGLARDEATEILSRYPLTEAARADLLAIAVNRGTGGMRRLMTVLRRALDIADRRGIEKISEQIITAANGLTLS